MKLLVILGDGGHSAEMLKLLELLGPQYEYSYMLADNDHISKDKITHPGPIYRVPLPLGKHASGRGLKRVMIGAWHQWRVLRRVRPQAILSTGASIAIPIAFFSRLSGVKVIHIETGSRIYEMSSTGEVMYRLAHLFFVQWEELQVDHPNAIYAGRLL